LRGRISQIPGFSEESRVWRTRSPDLESRGSRTSGGSQNLRFLGGRLDPGSSSQTQNPGIPGSDRSDRARSDQIRGRFDQIRPDPTRSGPDFDQSGPDLEVWRQNPEDPGGAVSHLEENWQICEIYASGRGVTTSRRRGHRDNAGPCGSGRGDALHFGEFLRSSGSWILPGRILVPTSWRNSVRVPKRPARFLRRKLGGTVHRGASEISLEDFRRVPIAIGRKSRPDR